MPSARVREILACDITERAFMGERDADTLRNDALACLDILAEASATRPASAFVGQHRQHLASTILTMAQ